MGWPRCVACRLSLADDSVDSLKPCGPKLGGGLGRRYRSPLSRGFGRRGRKLPVRWASTRIRYRSASFRPVGGTIAATNPISI